MKNKIATHFYVREEKKDKKGEAPIYLRITINGERAGISTDRSVNPELWDKAAERVAGRSEPARVINASLNNLIGKVEKYFSNLDVKNDVISVHQIIAELKGKSQNQMTLVKVGSFCALKANAQNYLISFAGTGISTIVTTVKVENLTKGTSLTLNGSDILRLNAATGVNSVEDNKSSELKIYPNPITDNSILEIFPPVAGNAVITVLDMIGKTVAQIQSYLENFRQDFILSVFKNGFYLISVKGKNYQFSGKLLSNGKFDGPISIEKTNNIVQEVGKKTENADSKGSLATINMAYTTGDLLKYTGTSSIYSTVKTDIPASNKTVTFNFVACTDGDNNNYPVVEIGTQVWMAENLKTTKYKDGTPVPLVEDAASWAVLNAPGYCWYNNDAATNKAVYGALYHCLTVNTGNLCPAGWHAPADAEWTALTIYLGGEIISGGKLKENGTSHWQTPNTGATNETGFTALPGGYRVIDGTFSSIGSNGYWTSSTEYNASNAQGREMHYNGNDVGTHYYGKRRGLSVRCIKDN